MVSDDTRTKLCSKCKAAKPVGAFTPTSRTRDGYLHRCRDCQNTNYREYARALRAEMLSAYGGCCTCCGETEPKFLALDHIHGGGAKHRQAIGKGATKMELHLRKLGWPKDQYQILCHNCNCAKGFYGECPHRTQGSNNHNHI